MIWLPIETAPKDGTPILLAGGEDDDADMAPPNMAQFCRAPCRAVLDRGIWVVAIAESGCIAVERHNPTHWARLPDGPK